MTPIDLSRLGGRDRWERVMEAWTDNSHPDAFTHTVRIAEPTRPAGMPAANRALSVDDKVPAMVGNTSRPARFSATGWTAKFLTSNLHRIRAGGLRGDDGTG